MCCEVGQANMFIVCSPPLDVTQLCCAIRFPILLTLVLAIGLLRLVFQIFLAHRFTVGLFRPKCCRIFSNSILRLCSRSVSSVLVVFVYARCLCKHFSCPTRSFVELRFVYVQLGNFIRMDFPSWLRDKVNKSNAIETTEDVTEDNASVFGRTTLHFFADNIERPDVSRIRRCFSDDAYRPFDAAGH